MLLLLLLYIPSLFVYTLTYYHGEYCIVIVH